MAIKNRIGVFLLGFACFSAAFHASAQANTDSMKLVLKTTIPDSNKIKTLNRLSWSLRSIDPESAMAYAQESVKLSKQIGFEKGLGDAYNNIGVLHYRRGEYIEATKSHFQALSLREKIGDKEGMALSYINLGNVYSDQNNNKTAIDNYLHAAKILTELNDSKRLPIVYLNIGAIFLAEKKFEEALPYCEKAKAGAIKNNDRVLESEALNNIGIVRESEKRYSDALEVYLQAYSISKSVEDKTEMVDNMINIGNMQRLLNKFDLALDWHSKTEILARQIGYLEGLRVLYADFSKDYEAMGNFKEALRFQIRFKELSDSLFNEENTSRINEMSAKWENDRNEKELIKKQQELFQENENIRSAEQRLWIIAGGSIILLLFIAYVLYANNRMRQAKLIITAQAEEIERNKK